MLRGRMRNATAMNRYFMFKLILILALLQGAFGLMRAYNWVSIGADLFKQGVLLMPSLGAVAILRGLLIALVAFLYLLFVCCAPLKMRPGWIAGCFAAVINLLLVINAVVYEAPLSEATGWAIVPMILLLYLLSRTGRDQMSLSAEPLER